MDNRENQVLDPEPLVRTGDLNPVSDGEPGEGLAAIITRFLRNCWLRRKMVLGILAIGLSIALVDAVRQKNVYTSTTTFMPPDTASTSSNLINMMGASSSAASLGSEMLGLETPGELYVTILESRNVLDGLITRFDLMHYYDARLLGDARKALAGNTVVSLDRKSGVITVSVTVANPELAANIAHGYVTELNRVLTDDSTSSARRERIFLEGRIKEIKQQLDDSSKALSQFSAKSGAIDPSSQSRSMVDEGLRLQGELITGRSQLAGLRQTYSEDNPRVRAAEARNAELQRQLNALGGRDQNPGPQSDSQKSPYPAASELPALGLTYSDLEREVRVQQALWEALTRQYEAARVEEAEQISAARVLDVADVPERKSGPSRRLIIMIGSVLSLLLACIAVIARTVWEGMDSNEEPKKLILDMIAAIMDRGRWYWSLPGMSSIHNGLCK
jgi:uncharacterized protein involved in exopolysaccharide biosynthesis